MVNMVDAGAVTSLTPDDLSDIFLAEHVVVEVFNPGGQLVMRTKSLISGFEHRRDGACDIDLANGYSLQWLGRCWSLWDSHERCHRISTSAILSLP